MGRKRKEADPRSQLFAILGGMGIVLFAFVGMKTGLFKFVASKLVNHSIKVGKDAVVHDHEKIKEKSEAVNASEK